jgi:radical SAM superfamily enzyme YgiQ (UPF0313 family)
MQRYMRTWQMEPLPAAMLSALLPQNVVRRFYDDRMETIPFDEPTDLVMISVETYTAKRAYQIASEYRQRGVPVVMGGFHATLCPQEVSQYCESIVIGEAEEVLAELLDDYQAGTPKKTYQSTARPKTLTTAPDRTIFLGKKYLPLRLVEFSRGCRFKCDFCAIQSYFHSTHNHRPVDRVVEEVQRVRKGRQLIFFIDDNLTSCLDEAKELMRALIPLGIRWVSQSAINVAYDEEALQLMKRSGCQGILIGLESLSPTSLKEMNKGFNLMKGGPGRAIANLRRHGLRVYGTFVFGYDSDTEETFSTALRFAKSEGLFIAAFNHITPFPGTPLYERLKSEGRMLYDAWWLDDRYRYSMIPFQPKHFTPDELQKRCSQARRDFYGWPSIGYRSMHRVNYRDPWMWINFWVINAMHHWDTEGRNGLPLGDEAWQGTLLKAEGAECGKLSL